MRLICRYLSLAVLTLLLTTLANAQSQIDLNIGFGAAQDKASTNGVDQVQWGPCQLGQPLCEPTPSLNSFFMGFGANLMLWDKLGVGMELNVQPGKKDYAQLLSSYGPFTTKSRVMFYEFTGIYRPVKTERAALQLVGGIGGASTRFYQAFSSNSLIGNINQSQYLSSSNHFMLRGGVGVQLYFSGNFFIRPQVDVRWIPNFEQFGRNVVTQEMVWLGYTIGER